MTPILFPIVCASVSVCVCMLWHLFGTHKNNRNILSSRFSFFLFYLFHYSFFFVFFSLVIKCFCLIYISLYVSTHTIMHRIILNCRHIRFLNKSALEVWIRIFFEWIWFFESVFIFVIVGVLLLIVDSPMCGCI